MESSSFERARLKQSAPQPRCGRQAALKSLISQARLLSPASYPRTYISQTYRAHDLPHTRKRTRYGSSVVFARYGITTVWSLGGEQEPGFKARASQNVSSLGRARIYVAGDVIVGKTPEEARQMVAKVAEAKPDVIKIRVDDQLGSTAKMPPAVYRAIIDEAHRRGLRVAAHIFYLDDAKDLLRAGADIIAHSVRDKEIDSEFISLMKARNVPYCPTLTRELSTFVYESKPAFFSDKFFLREADPPSSRNCRSPHARRRCVNLAAPKHTRQLFQSRSATLRRLPMLACSSLWVRTRERQRTGSKAISSTWKCR